jgi:hypothetical protein
MTAFYVSINKNFIYIRKGIFYAKKTGRGHIGSSDFISRAIRYRGFWGQCIYICGFFGERETNPVADFAFGPHQLRGFPIPKFFHLRP